jgi:tetratricopeptide (TPR) repeat protein
VKAGQDEEGKKLIEQSHWVLLGDAPARFMFLRALTERGFSAAARYENEMMLKVSEPNSHYWGVAQRRQAVSAARRKDYLKAAEGYELSMLRVLNGGTYYVLPVAYASIPAQVHQMRASALLAAGRYEEARKQIDLAMASWPASVELPIALVPALERAGHKKEAAALFDRCYGAFDKLSRDYPRCAWAHNSAAWMSACCRRNLDQALEHAKKAVELAPATAGHLDTLAEVHFQRGEKDEAVALQKRVVEMDPKRAYFRKQLRRLEAGDASADRPPEDDQE